MPQEPVVSDIMTRDVVALLEEQNLGQVLATFERVSFHPLPVLDNGKVVGMLGQRDVLRATVAGMDQSVVAQNREARFVERTFVRDLMKTTVFTARPEDSVRAAAAQMLEARVNSLPVVDAAGVLLGIVTSYDILRLVRDAP